MLERITQSINKIRNSFDRSLFDRRAEDLRVKLNKVKLTSELKLIGESKKVFDEDLAIYYQVWGEWNNRLIKLFVKQSEREAIFGGYGTQSVYAQQDSRNYLIELDADTNELKFKLFPRTTEFLVRDVEGKFKWIKKENPNTPALENINNSPETTAENIGNQLKILKMANDSIGKALQDY